MRHGDSTLSVCHWRVRRRRRISTRLVALVRRRGRRGRRAHRRARPALAHAQHVRVRLLLLPPCSHRLLAAAAGGRRSLAVRGHRRRHNQHQQRQAQGSSAHHGRAERWPRSPCDVCARPAGVVNWWWFAWEDENEIPAAPLHSTCVQQGFVIGI